MRVLEISAPLFVTGISKQSKNYWLNLNWYRNAHFHILDSAKKAFKKELDLSWIGEPIERCEVEFTFYYPSKAKRDIDNSMAVIGKFALDAISEAGIIVDDNHTCVVCVRGKFGGYDKENPRCEIVLTEC